VMEFVQGETIAGLSKSLKKRNDPRYPVPIACAIVYGALMGLHAAHTATDASGQPLGIVHRDVSPQNIIVGVDGVPRVLDFGVAKARVRIQTTQEGQVKGKLAYMAPEQLSGDVTVRTDVYAAGIVLWELLTGERLFPAETEMQLLDRILHGTIARPGDISPHVTGALDAVVMQALARDPNARFGSALEMARALEQASRPASQTEVATWLTRVAGDRLAKRRQKVAEIEQGVVPGLPRGAFGLPRIGAGDSSQDLQSVGAHTLPDRKPNFNWSIPASLAALAIGATAAVVVYWAHHGEPVTAAAAAASSAAQATVALPAPSAAPATTTPAATAAPAAPAPPATATAAPTASARAAESASASAPTARPAAASPPQPRPAAKKAAAGSADDLRSLMDSRR
ncbi:MAG TPA: serine/threonine-protein kinase, partial [Byssovorax sp.]